MGDADLAWAPCPPAPAPEPPMAPAHGPSPSLSTAPDVGWEDLLVVTGGRRLLLAGGLDGAERRLDGAWVFGEAR